MVRRLLRITDIGRNLYSLLMVDSYIETLRNEGYKNKESEH